MRYLGRADGAGGISNSTPAGIWFSTQISSPCPRNKRFFEWDYYIEPKLIGCSTELRNYLLNIWCKSGGSNGFGSSMTQVCVDEVFGPGEIQVTPSEIAESKKRFNALSAVEKLRFEALKWDNSGVPRPDFLIRVLLTLGAIELIEGKLWRNDVFVLYFFDAFRITGSERIYCLSCITLERVSRACGGTLNAKAIEKEENCFFKTYFEDSSRVKLEKSSFCLLDIKGIANQKKILACKAG